MGIQLGRGAEVTAMDAPVPDTAIMTVFGRELAVLAVRGDVDALRARELGALFDAAFASGYTSVVLDITDLASMDAEGLAVAANAASRLVAAGGRLTVRSAWAASPGVFDTTWLADQLPTAFARPGRKGISRGEPGSGKLGAEQDLGPLDHLLEPS